MDAAHDGDDDGRRWKHSLSLSRSHNTTHSKHPKKNGICNHLILFGKFGVAESDPHKLFNGYLFE